jgi:hypothetical protein
MRWIAGIIPLVAAATLGACASLTAEAPLFSAADEDAAPLVEGVWVRVSESCPRQTIEAQGPLPDGCLSIDLRRTSAGWAIQTPAPSAAPAFGEPPAEAYGVIASAMERDIDGLTAPLYLYERVERGEDGAFIIRYDGIIPIGEAPAREASVIFDISCGEVLAEGPIAGVTQDFDEDGRTVSCTAHSQNAVRAAMRRAAIERLPYLHDSRLVLRPASAARAPLVAAARP